MIAWDKRQTRRGTRPPDRPPVHAGWLLALAYIGCLSHPFFDWLNSYGVRLLEPFSHRWFYGDALFIIDPWLLAMLIAGVWFSRQREKIRRADWARPARLAVGGVIAFLGLNLGLSASIASLASPHFPSHATLVTNPVPLTFWRRQVLWRTEGRYGSFVTTAWPWDGPTDIHPAQPIGMDDRSIAESAKHSPEARAFLFWSRMPIAKRDGDAIILGDQRFEGSITGDRFNVRLEP